MYRFSVAAIVKDEYEYLKEWFAYHLSVGVEHFYMADNGSTDGTSALLEALESIGLVTRFFQKKCDGSQLKAYNTILKNYGAESRFMAFIDADEFIVDSETRLNNVTVIDKIIKRMENPSIGAMGLNWRIFGSGGLASREEGLVVERFTHCANNNEPKNLYFKSIVKPSHVNFMRVHHAMLTENSEYITNKGEILQFLDGVVGGLSTTHEPEINIHHYVIKSLQEYKEKKQKRGDAMRNDLGDKGMGYFTSYDLNDCENTTMLPYVSDTKEMLLQLNEKLELTSMTSKIKGHIAVCNADYMAGWFMMEERPFERVKMKIYINQESETLITANKFRYDLLKLGTGDGCYAFHYHFPQPLNKGDEVTVAFYGNTSETLPNKFCI